MAVDINRIVLAAAEAALKQDAPAKNKGLSTGRALAAGATLVVVGRVAAGPGGRFVRDKIQERLSNDSEAEDPRDEELDEEPEAEVDEDELEAEVDEEEEPEAEVDDEDEEPEAEVDEDEEPEAEVDEDEEPEAEVDEDEEPEAEVDEDEEPEAEVDEDEPEAEVDEDEPEAELDEEEPEAELDEDEPETEVDEETGLEEDGERGNGARRPRHHPLFEQALAGKGAQRRRSPQPPKGRKPTGRPRIAPPRRPTRPSTNGG